MKRKNKKPTRAVKQAQGSAPVLHKCNACPFKGTKYQVKEHQEVCNALR